MGLLDKQFTDDNIVITTVDDLLNWARLSSLWQVGFGLACCAIEMMATSASHYDFDRFGVIPRPSPRQSDVIIISGTVTLKMALRVKRFMNKCPIQNMLFRWEAAQTAADLIGNTVIMS